jgi:hypothetical protein
VEDGVGPRKRGGQRGKRKLRDMYLALDGSALLTLGTLLPALSAGDQLTCQAF